MGNKFGCDITCRAHSFFENEMSFKPIKSELIGSSLKDEGFIEFNSLLHNQNFSANYFKAKSLSKSLKTSKKHIFKLDLALAPKNGCCSCL